MNTSRESVYLGGGSRDADVVLMVCSPWAGDNMVEVCRGSNHTVARYSRYCAVEKQSESSQLITDFGRRAV
jgi:hypothetical protein